MDRSYLNPHGGANPKSLIPNPYAVLCSSMARRTARELLNLVLGDQPPAELNLIGRLDVVDAEHRAARTHVAFGAAVAVEAPLHLQRLLLPHERHAVHLAVAGRAADALVHVDAVVEVDEVRQIVHARPLNRAARSEAVAHGIQQRAVREDLRV